MIFTAPLVLSSSGCLMDTLHVLMAETHWSISSKLQRKTSTTQQNLGNGLSIFSLGVRLFNSCFRLLTTLQYQWNSSRTGSLVHTGRMWHHDIERWMKTKQTCLMSSCWRDWLASYFPSLQLAHCIVRREMERHCLLSRQMRFRLVSWVLKKGTLWSILQLLCLGVVSTQ